MTAAGRIEVSERSDGAISKWQVGIVSMFLGENLGAEVEGCGGPYAVFEVSTKAWIFL